MRLATAGDATWGSPRGRVGRAPVPSRGAPDLLLGLQRSAGNAAVTRLLRQRRWLARTPVRPRGTPVEAPGTGYDGLLGTKAIGRNLNPAQIEATAKFRADLEKSLGFRGDWGSGRPRPLGASRAAPPSGPASTPSFNGRWPRPTAAGTTPCATSRSCRGWTASPSRSAGLVTC